LEVLFPHLAGLRIDRVFSRGRSVRIEVAAAVDKAACSACGTLSARAHSHYERRLTDVAVGGQELVVHLRVRRYFCDNAECERKTFAERFPELAVPYSRRTVLLRRVLEKIALSLGGRPGARLTQQLRVEVSRSTLLRLIRALPVPEPGVLPAVGVDDFAFRRGANYGTVLVDMLTHKPVDLLPDRLSDTFAAWLRAHPGAEIICRDRASGYAEGARLGAPNAIQVADRWHLLHNLTEAVDRVVRAHRPCLRTPPDQTEPSTTSVADAPSPQVSASQTVASGSRAELTRLRHAEVHALHGRGVGTTAISTALKLDAKTVRRYTRAVTADELLTDVPKRGSCLDPYTDYLAQRWAEGCVNAVRLTEEARARGYRGSERSVRRLLQTWRTSPTPAKPAGSVMTPREVTMWMMRPADKLTADEHVRLGEVLDRCQTLRTVNQLVSDFAGMARELHGQHLDTWITQARASAITQLAGFAEGLGKDYDAVRNGLTLPWSSGPVEGNVTRLKTIKRQMYGRANFDLLRRRVLLST